MNAWEEMKEDNTAFSILLPAFCVCKGLNYQCKSSIETWMKLLLRCITDDDLLGQFWKFY